MSVREQIREVQRKIERFGKYRFAETGIEVTREKTTYLLESYTQTLARMHLTMEGEPPSGVTARECEISWEARPHPSGAGVTVRQVHTAWVRPEMRDLVSTWKAAGFPFPTGGGVYGTVPNKSLERVKDLAKFPELRDPIGQLGEEDLWIAFWDHYLRARDVMSRTLLDSLRSRADPEALSRHNEEAGMGLSIRGSRLKRKDTPLYANDLGFLIQYQWDMGIANAAIQLAALDSEHVFLITVYDPRIKGSVASRSDMDVKDVQWNGEHLTITGEAGTRQVGSDGTGALSNSYSEKRLGRQSVTEEVLRALRPSNVFYPFIDREKLLDVWATPVSRETTPFLIGEDLGLVEPVKSGADGLFSRGFIKIGGKVLPLMLSGSGWTQAVYIYFHAVFAKRLRNQGYLLCLGDDVNLVSLGPTEEIFHPYIKVKSTKPETGDKKVLGWWVRTTKDQAIFATIPRVIKTLSSASKRGGYWGERLSRLAPTGKLALRLEDHTEEEIKKSLPDLMPYYYWAGKPDELRAHLSTLWSSLSPARLAQLIANKEELAYALAADGPADTGEDDEQEG